MELVYGSAEEAKVCIWFDKYNVLEKIRKNEKKIKDLVVKEGLSRTVFKNALPPARVNLSIIGKVPEIDTVGKVLGFGEIIMKVYYNAMWGVLWPEKDNKNNRIRGKVIKIRRKKGYTVLVIDQDIIDEIPILIGNKPNLSHLEVGDVVEIVNAQIYAVVE